MKMNDAKIGSPNHPTREAYQAHIRECAKKFDMVFESYRDMAARTEEEDCCDGFVVMVSALSHILETALSSVGQDLHTAMLASGLSEKDLNEMARSLKD